MLVRADFEGGPCSVAGRGNDFAHDCGLAGLPRTAPDHYDHERRFLSSAMSARSSVILDIPASCWRYSFKGRAGVPQTVCPERMIFDVRTPQPDPKTAPVSIRALSPIPTCPPITA